MDPICFPIEFYYDVGKVKDCLATVKRSVVVFLVIGDSLRVTLVLVEFPRLNFLIDVPTMRHKFQQLTY